MDPKKARSGLNYGLWNPSKNQLFQVSRIKNGLKMPSTISFLSRLDSKKIKPSPEADRPTLIRRLSLDLTGLLPTPEEVKAFNQDQSPDAYQKVVDRLLKSQHFGERWARHWLDEARYADSAGYEKDSARADAYRWRDWVIKAINSDMPFDQFTIKQIAGDLPPQRQSPGSSCHRFPSYDPV